MSQLSTLPPTSAGGETLHWTARHGKPIIFVILTLVAVGVYLAFSIPVAVFPSTDFPRIVVGADVGVYPIDQMLVTVTKPLEEAVNTVPGLESGYLDHQPRQRGDRSVFQLERRYEPDPAVGERGNGADSAHASRQHAAHRQSPDVCGVSNSWLQPDFRSHSSNHALGNSRITT